MTKIAGLLPTVTPCQLSAGGMGRNLYRRSHQWHPSATHLLSTEPALSAVLPDQRRPVQGKVNDRNGYRGQARVAGRTRAADQSTRPGCSVDTQRNSLRQVPCMIRHSTSRYTAGSVLGSPRKRCYLLRHPPSDSCFISPIS